MNKTSSTSETTSKPVGADKPAAAGKPAGAEGDLGKLEIKFAREKTFPLKDPAWATRIRVMGDVRETDLRILIRKSLLKEIIEYSNRVKSRETGGLLIGNVFRDGDIRFIEIEAFVSAEHAEENPASLKFTHDTWSSVTKRWDELKEQRKDLEDSVMVGWHHTHPTFGIFLSSHDRFIHEGYFDLPFQVALVVDPVSERFGFFQWRRAGSERKLVDCGFCCVED
jgi:proteasome lid subunit RPN8/RPN11